MQEEGFCVMICAMSVAELPIQIDREKIAEFCRRRGIRKLSLFGSVLRDDFDAARSDMDVLAEYEPNALKGVGFRYFGYGEELAAIIGRRVDFCSHLNKTLKRLSAVKRFQFMSVRDPGATLRQISTTASFTTYACRGDPLGCLA